MKIGLLSDTHSYIDNHILNLLKGCDQIWHAGDIGDLSVMQAIEALNIPLKAVYGNIDSADTRLVYPEHQVFDCEGAKIWITHIGAYPPKYNRKILSLLDKIQPDIFICGHSHILKVIADKQRKLLHLNPGAAGQHGFHSIRTMLLFEIKNKIPQNLSVVELGKRGSIKKAT